MHAKKKASELVYGGESADGLNDKQGSAVLPAAPRCG